MRRRVDHTATDTPGLSGLNVGDNKETTHSRSDTAESEDLESGISPLLDQSEGASEIRHYPCTQHNNEENDENSASERASKIKALARSAQMNKVANLFITSPETDDENIAWSWKVSFSEVGDLENGSPVFLFPGINGNRMVGAILDDEAKAASLRIITPDRPGYGQTQPYPRSVACNLAFMLDTFCRVIESLAAYLGLTRYSIIGHSCGAIYSVALARRAVVRKIKQNGSYDIPAIFLISGFAPLSIDSTSSAMKLLSKCTPASVIRVSVNGLNRFTAMSLLSLSSTANFFGSSSIDIPELCRLDCEEGVHGGPGFDATIALESCGPLDLEPYTDLDLPIYAWHGGKDAMVPLIAVKNWMAALPRALLVKIYAERDHGLIIHPQERKEIFLAIGRLCRSSTKGDE